MVLGNAIFYLVQGDCRPSSLEPESKIDLQLNPKV